MNFGVRLKELRLEMRLTRKELANELETSYHSIAKYETSNRFPDREGLIKISDFFNVSSDYLLCRSNFRNLNSIFLSNDHKKDIMYRLESINNDLKGSEEFIFNGEPLYQGAKNSLIEALEIGLSIAKLKQKKYLLKDGSPSE